MVSSGGKVRNGTTIDANELRKYVIQTIHGSDERFTFFYDETNNIRKLYLTETGFNVAKCENFVIGGIVLRDGSEIGDVDSLRDELRLQPTATEIKLRHIAKGGFEELLASPKLGVVLSWLIDRGISIHFSNINVLYWSIIDIVDSIVAEDSFRVYLPMHMELKNELYRLVSHDTPYFLEMLRRFGYPNVSMKDTTLFLSEMENFLEDMVAEDANLPAQILKEMTRNASRRLLELAFVSDGMNGVLIDSFHNFFLRPIYIFKNSTHIFDHEKEVEKILADYQLVDGNRQIDFRFSDSKKEIGIQLSDVVVGFLGKYFSFIEDTSMRDLLNKKDQFSATQANNLELLRKLIDASDEVSNAFCHRVAPLDSIWKSNSFLHRMPVAPHLLR